MLKFHVIILHFFYYMLKTIMTSYIDISKKLCVFRWNWQKVIWREFQVYYLKEMKLICLLAYNLILIYWLNTIWTLLWFNSKEHLSEEYEYCGIVCWKAIKAHALRWSKIFWNHLHFGKCFRFWMNYYVLSKCNPWKMWKWTFAFECFATWHGKFCVGKIMKYVFVKISLNNSQNV